MNSRPKGSKRKSSLSSVGSSSNGQQQRKSVKSFKQLPPDRESKKQQHSSNQRVNSSEHKRTNRSPKVEASNLTESTNEDALHTKQQVASWHSSATDCQPDDYRKQNHCEIEKRRRDKMNHYIMELASLIPSSGSHQSKYDKLTVLRTAVQHVKSLRSSLCSFSTFRQRPSFLSSGNLLKNLILQMASQEVQDNLFMVVTCDRGKVLFVSQSAKDILNQEQHELTGQCLFDMLHKDDVSKVKEQISYHGFMPKQMLVDSKTLQKVKHSQRQYFSQMQNLTNSAPQPGARRSFFCRMKNGPNKQHLSYGTDPNSNSIAQTANTVDITQASELPNQSDNIGQVNQSGNPRIGGEQHQQLTSVPSVVIQCTDNVNSNAFNTYDRVENEVHNTKSDKISEVERCKSKVKTATSSTMKPSKTICRKSGSSSSSSISSSSSSGAGSMDESSNVGRSSEHITSDDGSSISKSVKEIIRNNTSLKTSNNETSSAQVSKKHPRYIVMHCSGYLKAITIRNDEFDQDDFDDNASENTSSDEEEERKSSRTINCLVAVCRRSPIYRDLKPDRPLTFTCRYSMEGKFLFADQRTTVALGYTPQQLLGTSHYAYCHKDSVNTFKECHRQCILKSEAVSSDIYQFKRANGQNLWLQTSLKSFINPWTKFIDYIVASHTTAEGNDPRYNEGCVPTKFNQDMTGEAPQSSSPSSSSSLPSMDSKKPSSPSSSSPGSSYSMESYASGGCIQALLNQIDRAKSGGIKHGPKFHRKKVDSSVTRSDGSAGKSSDDMGNFSDLQSCSSFSSQNSAVYADYANLQGVINFGEGNNQSTVENQNNTSGNNNFNNPKSSQGTCDAPNYQPMCQQLCNPKVVVNDTATFAQTNTDTRCGCNEKTCTRFSNKLVKQARRTVKQNQRQCNVHQYYYKNQAQSGSSLSSDTGNESAPLSNSSGSVFSDISAHRGRRDDQNAEVQPRNQIKKPDICGGSNQERHCQPTYAIRQVDTTNMSIEPLLVPEQIDGIGGCRRENNYTNQVITVGSYMSRDVNPQYSETVDMSQRQQMHEQNDLQVNMVMTIPEQQSVQRREPPESTGQMNVPIMWAPTENSYQDAMHSTGAEQICKSGDAPLMNMYVSNSNNQMIAQQTVHCQQCANRQSALNDDTALNGINLNSLMVNCDLDEDQLLEYLAACRPEPQFYHVHNNTYPL